MEINVINDDGEMNVELDGRLDTNSSFQMETDVIASLDGVNYLTLDLTKLSYMSSAGLRIFLACQKKLNSVKGTMIIKNANETIMDIFESTGFIDILTIENNV